MAIDVRKTGSTSQEMSFSTAASPEEAFDYLADFQKHPEWSTELLSLEKTSEGPVGVGTTYKATETMKPGSKMKSTTYCEITALDRPRLIEWQASAEPKGPLVMRSRWAFVIEPEGAGSRVTQRMSMEPPNIGSKAFLKTFTAIADGLMGGMGASPKNATRHIERLKEILEERQAKSAG